MALNAALDTEGQAQQSLALAMEFPGDERDKARRKLDEAIASTRAAFDAFAIACEEETRASIAAWIEAAPARMRAQAAVGAKPFHFMCDGLLAAAEGLARDIRNKSDLKG